MRFALCGSQQIYGSIREDFELPEPSGAGMGRVDLAVQSVGQLVVEI